MHAVHFDLDGTLMVFDRPYADLLADACERVLDTRDPAVAEAYSTAFFERLRPVEPNPYEVGARAAIDAADADADPERFVAALRDLEYGAATVREGMPALLGALAERPLGVVSNGVGAWQRGKLDAVGLAGRFDSVVTSYDAGVAKPAPGVFAHAAERLPADDHTMVGDDTEADIEGARAAGWRAVHVEDVASPADLP
ncbi:HAD family hydrolase [Halosegnis marinus]|uniref:HAD family hydrolase n=1 Tax=Halosegnis marinus TaxID=3034023 RepID=A0ABD5ZNI8_9EURY|nr:HAD family hydrolase [Halosegnis sp. DT85]